MYCDACKRHIDDINVFRNQHLEHHKKYLVEFFLNKIVMNSSDRRDKIKK